VPAVVTGGANPSRRPRVLPDPRYFGENGEINARFRRSDTPPDFRSPAATTEGPTDSPGTAYHYLATMELTGGDFGLCRVDLGPEPGGPGTHFHRTMSERFFVLSGTLQVYDGVAWTDATTGDYLYVPPGGLHAFRNESGEPVSMLMLFAPGAPREAYFEGITQLAELSPEERAAFLPPPRQLLRVADLAPAPEARGSRPHPPIRAAHGSGTGSDDGLDPHIV